MECLKKIYALLFLFLFVIFQNVAAYTYLPNLNCFDKEDYNAGRQNWDIDIDEHGVVYFGNSDGLLYNVYGEWGFASMSEKGVIRAVHAENDTIWCGGVEFGFFTKSEVELVFSNLGTLDGRQIWNIEILGNQVFFQSEDKIFIYNKILKTIKTIDFPGGIWSIVKWRGKIWMILRDGQTGYFLNEKFHSTNKLEQLTKHEVRKLFVHKDFLHIVMFEGGVYRFDGENIHQITLPEQITGSTLFTGIPYDEDSYCLGSVTDGLIRLGSENKIQNWVNSEHGLIDNTVLSMKRDDLGNIWLGLDYGIAKIELQSAINQIFYGAATYSIIDFQGRTYLSTNKGLFFSSDKGEFEFFDNSGGQVWVVREIGEELFICHNKGLLKLKNQQIVPVEDYAGFVDIAKFGGTNYYLFSTYHGLILTRREGEQFIYIKNLNVWGYPKLLYDKHNQCVWTEIQGRDIVKLSLSSDFSVMEDELSGISKVFNTRNGFYFSNDENLLQYKNEKFIKPDHPLLNAVTGGDITALDISSDGNIVAYIQHNEVKLQVLLPDGNIHSYNSLLKSLGKNVNQGSEYIDLRNDFLRLATDRGVTVFDINYRTGFKKSSSPVISSLTLLNKKYRHMFFPFSQEGLSFDAGNKDIKFRLSINKSDYDVVEYRYRLDPKEEKWSEWSATTDEVFYPQVKGGTYLFKLQSRINGGIPNETSLKFTIDKLWYQTSWILLPILLIVLLWIFGVIFIMTRISRRKLKKQKQLYNQRDAQKTLTMKNEQLLQYTEIISHKNEFLNKIKSGLETMRSSEAQRWTNMIADEVNNEKKEFLFHKLFSEIHQDFISRLTEKFPDLTSNDVRVLSFIRINLDKKEISNLMNISPRSLDTNRYRLRKKLNLDHNIDLNQFIRDF